MAASSSSHADSEALYYHHDDSLPTDLEPNYNLQALPLAGLTAASAQCGNLFPTPQTLLTSTSSSLESELPVSMPCNTVTPSAMDSGSVFFGIADHNDGSDPTLFDYHSSDSIFDNFNATFGSF